MVATIAFAKKTIAEAKKASEKLFQGEITIGKKECWLIGTILLLAGITIGLLNAPLTHGVNFSLFSHNWSDNGNNNPVGGDVGKLCKTTEKKYENEKEEANDSKSSCTCKKKKRWITC